MGPENMTVGRVYQEIYRATLYAADVTESQKLEDIRETMAAWYGTTPDEIKLKRDGHELSCWIQMQAVESITFPLTPDGLREARR